VKNTYIILMSAAITMSTAYSQNNMSFKFGLPISLAQVLLKDKTIAGKGFTPTISCGYFSLSATEKETVDGTTDKQSQGIHIFLPRIGLRVPGKATNDLKRYYYTDAFTVIPIFTGDDADEIREEWNETIDLYGLIAGTGVEYFFSKEFSIGGEISMNVLVNAMKDEHEEWDGDYWSGSEVTVENEISLQAGAVFTQFTLNYYFN